MRKENEKKQKKLVNKAKKIRGIIMMTLICVMMLSAATYAWFTLSNTAKIANLTMTVGEATGLQIAKNVKTDGNNTPGKYGSVLSFGDSTDSEPAYKITGKLLPATTTDGNNFLMPTYNDNGEVSGTKSADKKLDNSTSDNNAEGYYYETNFYMKALGSKDIKIILKDGSDLSSTDSAKGTYVLAKDSSTNKKGYNGCQAIRISLTDDTNTLIYEPNSESHGTGGTSAELASGVTISSPASTSIQNNSGVFTAQSQALTLKGNVDTLITMRIWIEGTDNDCVNEISLNEIIAQLQFEEQTTTN